MIDLALDYHAHVLPGCDHGSDSLETSLAQLRMAHAAGIATVCATPHFYPQREDVESFLERRWRSYSELQPHLAESRVGVMLGAEVLICDGMDHMPGLTMLCREGTRELLLEMPFYDWPKPILRTLYRLLERDDISVVLAHADRYPTTQIEKLGERGVELQLNAESLACHPLRRRCLLGWIKNGWVKYLGSDIHMLGENYEYWVKSSKLIIARASQSLRDSR